MVKLNGMDDFIDGFIVLSDKTILAWSKNRGVCIWDKNLKPNFFQMDMTVDRVFEYQEKIIMLGNNRTIFSCDYSNGEFSFHELYSHNNEIIKINEASSGNLISWSIDGVIRVFNPKKNIDKSLRSSLKMSASSGEVHEVNENTLLCNSSLDDSVEIIETAK